MKTWAALTKIDRIPYGGCPHSDILNMLNATPENCQATKEDVDKINQHAVDFILDKGLEDLAWVLSDSDIRWPRSYRMRVIWHKHGRYIDCSDCILARIGFQVLTAKEFISRHNWEGRGREAGKKIVKGMAEDILLNTPTRS